MAIARGEELERLMRELIGIDPPTQIVSTPRRTTYNIPPPPSLLIVTFIGGPKNSTQEFIEKYHDWQDGRIRAFIGDTIYSPSREPSFETWKYRITFLPLSETPFTDAQCAVGVFVP